MREEGLVWNLQTCLASIAKLNSLRVLKYENIGFKEPMPTIYEPNVSTFKIERHKSGASIQKVY
jgi:hypothetical protein